jgi:uncharacterized C2H2 Zn-finger protein
MSSSETTGGINCPECTLTFDSMEELERHSKKQHAQGERIRDRGAERESTNRSFGERVSSRNNEERKFPERNVEQTVHACRDCALTFYSLNDLTTHYAKAHPESK